MAQFLFLHPNYKRLIDFLSDSVVSSFLKQYRQHELKQQNAEMVAAYLSELNQISTGTNSTQEALEIEVYTFIF